MSYSERGWEIVSAYPESAYSDEICGILCRAAGSHERIIHPHRTITVFRNAMAWGGELARQFLDTSEVSGLGSYYFSQSAGYAEHRDNDFIQAIPGSFLTVWLALADTGNGNGGLVIDRKLIVVPKGSAIILDGDTPHRSCAGFGPRPVLVLTYIKTGYPFRAGREERVEVPL